LNVSFGTRQWLAAWAVWPVINGGSMVERSYAADLRSIQKKKAFRFLQMVHLSAWNVS
jgi:hypothetical protein